MCAGALFAAVMVQLSPNAAHAQFTWGGGTSTDYNTASNWSPSMAYPHLPGQIAFFGSTLGFSTVTVGPGPMLPSAWLIEVAAVNYTMTRR
jgi:hypothetical protein